MTATTVITLVRKFKFGATVLDDPAPHLPPDQALALFVPNYPFLASARLGEPVQRGLEILEYPIEKQQVQVKGASSRAAQPAPKPRAARRATTAARSRRARAAAPTRRRSAVDAAIEALEAWGRAPAAVPAAITTRWSGVSELAQSVIEREASPIRDAFSIPLA